MKNGRSWTKSLWLKTLFLTNKAIFFLVLNVQSTAILEVKKNIHVEIQVWTACFVHLSYTCIFMITKTIENTIYGQFVLNLILPCSVSKCLGGRPKEKNKICKMHIVKWSK